MPAAQVGSSVARSRRRWATAADHLPIATALPGFRFDADAAIRLQRLRGRRVAPSCARWRSPRCARASARLRWSCSYRHAGEVGCCGAGVAARAVLHGPALHGLSAQARRHGSLCRPPPARPMPAAPMPLSSRSVCSRAISSSSSSPPLRLHARAGLSTGAVGSSLISTRNFCAPARSSGRRSPRTPPWRGASRGRRLSLSEPRRSAWPTTPITTSPAPVVIASMSAAT